MPRSDEELSGLRKVLTLQMVKHWSFVVASEPTAVQVSGPGCVGHSASSSRRCRGRAPAARDSSTTAVTRPRTLPR